MFLAILFIIFQSNPLMNGIDRTDLYLPKLKNKRIALTINHSSQNSNGKPLIQILIDNQISIQAIFTPEHGLSGNWVDGEKQNEFNKRVHSLYGNNKKPTSAQLKNIDLMIYDIQDVGLRFYTYISTLAYVMEACAENSIPLLILDRSSMMNANQTEGFVLDTAFSSFVGMFPIPVKYAMTIAELAQLIKGERLMQAMDKLQLEVIRIADWDRKTDSGNDGSFIQPSPNLVDLEAIYLYSGLCFLEGTNVSEGRGTETPFKQIGAPWLRTEKLISSLSHFPGISIETVKFTPITIKGKAYRPKYENEECSAVRFQITDKSKFSGFLFGMTILKAIYDQNPEFIARNTLYDPPEFDYLNKLSGSDFIKKNLAKNNFLELVREKEESDLNQFELIRKKYLIYH